LILAYSEKKIISVTLYCQKHRLKD